MNNISENCMNILAIESSGLVASAAVVEDGLLKTEFTVNNKLTHSETLLPMVRSMLDISGLDMHRIDAIAVSAGPGSFTGLRIGAATAKGLALALNIPIISVSSLKAMAYGLSELSESVICPIMDARREQVYSAAYRAGAEVLTEEARDIHDYLEELGRAGSNIRYIFEGDGVPVYKDIIVRELQGDVTFAGTAFNRQRAADVAELGASLYESWLSEHGLTAEEVRLKGADSVDCFEGAVMNSDDFVPTYLRKTQAEREMAEGKLGDPGQHSLSKMQDKGRPRKA